MNITHRAALASTAAFSLACALPALTPGAQATPHGAPTAHPLAMASATVPASTASSTSTTSTRIRTTTGDGAGVAHLPATRVTRANLPSPRDIVVPGGHPVTSSTIRGHWDDRQGPCRTFPWADLGSNAEFTRQFATNIDARTEQFAEATVASFGSHAAAVRAAERMDATLQCHAGVQELADHLPGSDTVVRRTVRLPGGQVAHLTLLTYRSTLAPGMLATDAIGVVATGTHVELVEVRSLAAPGRQGLQPMVATLTRSLPALRR